MDYFLVRKKFLEYFERQGHRVVSSSSLLPDDPSVLLTTAGVQQFKKYYTGELDPMRDFGGRRVASAQKCFRTSDIDEVGDDTHLTFFEMLGNFSFGDYLKEESIRFGYEFIVKELGVDVSRIEVSVFEGTDGVPRDEESFRIWREEMGIPEERIHFSGMEDNFWGPTGKNGPCGPTTEIYVDGIEVWNIVFNQFFCSGSREELLSGKASLENLSSPGVDTGMGLERLVTIINAKKSVYEVGPLQKIAEEIEGVVPEERERRMIADHLRSALFLISDGVMPSNKEVGYVLRRLIRRVLARERKIPYEKIFEQIEGIYKGLYDLRAHEAFQVLTEERGKFEKSLGKGLREMASIMKIGAKEAFRLYESYGLSYEVIKDRGEGRLAFTRAEFDAEMEKHREVSKAGMEKKFGGHGLILDTGELKAGSEEEVKKVTRLHTATHLLQAALREVLGPEVKQAGSDITSERLRFDYAAPRKLTEEELRQVETWVRNMVSEDLLVSYEEMPIEEAKRTGALYFFKEKYPERVKVYYVGKVLMRRSQRNFAGGLM